MGGNVVGIFRQYRRALRGGQTDHDIGADAPMAVVTWCECVKIFVMEAAASTPGCSAS